MIDVAFLPFVFITGIASSVQPCLFPLLPTYFSFLASTSDEKTDKVTIDHYKRGLLSGFFLTLGILCVFLFLAMLVKIGQLGLNTLLTNYVVEFNLFLSLILVFLGIIMILNIELSFFYRVPGLASSLDLKNTENKMIASFLLGIAYTAIAAPCAAPIFLSLLATTIFFDPLSISLVMIVFSLGAGVPFVVIGGLFPKFKQDIQSGYGRAVRFIRPISGFILLLVSFYLLNIYVLPFYPINLGFLIFYGIQDSALNLIYILITFLFVIVILTVIIVTYIRKNRNRVMCS